MFYSVFSVATAYFFLISLINVILSSAKSICTVRYGRSVNVLMNVVSYSFYAIVVKQMTALPLMSTVIATAVANAIGVWTSYTILDRLQKDRLWKVEVVVSKCFTERLHYELRNIPHNFIELGPRTLFNFYCETKADTSRVIKHCKDFNGKFFAAENKL
jgi:uncharacterized protein YebE (UPF0316 family)